MNDIASGAEQLHQIAVELVTEQVFCTSLQVAVHGPRHSGVHSYGYVSPGRPTSPDHLFSVHCATKPLIALAVAVLADQGAIDLDAPVCEQVPTTSPAHGLTCDVWSVLNHTAGLADPSMLVVNLTPLEHRDDLVRRAIASNAPGYSEYSGHAVLAEMIAAAAGPAASFIRRSIIEPLDLEPGIRMQFSPRELEADSDMIGFYVRGLPTSPLPIVNDWSPHLACIDRTCLGGYASASGLAALYQALGRVYGGEVVKGLPAPPTLHLMLNRRSPRQVNEILGRDCSFAAGFMVNLSDHGYGDGPAPDSFGHTGLLGASFGFYDPPSGVAGAVISNGLHHSPDDLDFLRSRLVTAMITSAGGAPTAS